MTTASLATPPRASRNSLLGLLAVLAAPVFLVQWLASPPSSELPSDGLGAMLGLCYLVGFACSVVALRRDRATGRGAGAATLFAVQLLGLALAAGQQLQDALQRRPLGDTVYRVCDLAWPASHLLMLAAGVAVLRARVWTGWRRWAPLACGLALPLSFAAAAAFGRPGMVAAFPILTSLTFGALGVAAMTAPPA
jgi:hypothetical protein